MVASILDRFLKLGIHRGVLELARPEGRVTRFGRPCAGFPEVRVRFTDKGVERGIMKDLALGAAEAFMDGRLIIEQGDILQLVQLLEANNRWERASRPSPLKSGMQRAITLIRGVNRAARAKANIAHHYDIGNDLYRLFLDSEHMQYSCAYWPRADMTLEEAQTAKLAHIAAKLALAPGQRVLDIGCGWGGMAIYLARNADVSVLGITLSQEQLMLARQRAEQAGVADRVAFELIDYRELVTRGESFDRIVSVGMFEHVGRAQFNQFFLAVQSLLAEDGLMLLHTIGRLGSPGSTDAFTHKYIFPGGYIPALSETVASSEKFRLIATDVENLRLHYAFTLREWYKRCVDNRERIIAMMDERFFRMWTFYLAGATAAFEYGAMCNYQIQYARDRRTLPLTRAYIDAAESLFLSRDGNRDDPAPATAIR